jgi:hypothetical protein
VYNDTGIQYTRWNFLTYYGVVTTHLVVLYKKKNLITFERIIYTFFIQTKEHKQHLILKYFYIFFSRPDYNPLLVKNIPIDFHIIFL